LVSPSADGASAERIAWVSDGDTIVLANRARVRLVPIDAPRGRMHRVSTPTPRARELRRPLLIGTASAVATTCDHDLDELALALNASRRPDSWRTPRRVRRTLQELTPPPTEPLWRLLCGSEDVARQMFGSGSLSSALGSSSTRYKYCRQRDFLRISRLPARRDHRVLWLSRGGRRSGPSGA
jgi:hypothetical protein